MNQIVKSVLFALVPVFLCCEKEFNNRTQIQKVKNLKAFAKAYGYVKYFHPSDGASLIDWTKFAIYGAQLVEKCESDEELVNTLNGIFKPLAPSIEFSSTPPTGYDIKNITPNKFKDFQPTFWQHQGVKFGMDPQLRTPYRSSRVNGIVFKDYSYVTGKLIMRINASKYLGKRLKYSSWAKKEGDDIEKAYLRFVVDKSDGTSDLKRETITEENWEQYEIITDIDSSALSIQVGTAMKGNGAILFDLPQLFHERNGKWIEIGLPNPDFEEKIPFIANQEHRYENHWYFEGIGYSVRLTEYDKYSGSNAAILEYSGIVEKEKGKPLFPKRPEFGEILEKELVSGIHLQMPLVLYSSDMGTYPKSDSVSLEKTQKTLRKVSEEPTDLHVRLGNIINTYNVFQHFYPYFDILDINWEKELENALAQSFQDSTAKEHLITLQKLTSPLKDGHINVVYNRNKEWATPSITWEQIEGELVITNVMDREIPLNVGDVITKIDGTETIEYLKEINSRISAGTKGYLNHRAEQLSLMGEKDSELSVTVKGKDIKLVRNSYPHSFATRMSDFERINDSVSYLNLNSISMEDIEKAIPELTKSKSIICDLRVYPNRNHGFISYLLKENDTATSWMQIPQSIYPNREKLTYLNSNWLLPSKKPYLGDKQIIFITSRTAISYAESYMGFIEGYNLATIIGQPTAGTNGNINRFELSEGFKIRWTGMKVTKHDGSRLHGIGFLPDIYVNRTIEGLKAERDEFLEAAIELTK